MGRHRILLPQDINSIKELRSLNQHLLMQTYRNGSFYNFYQKYSLTDTSNETITTDLNLLRNRPIPHGPFPYYAHPERLDIPYIDYFKILLQHVKDKDPYVTNLTDVDVHQGKIFQTDGRNAYDVLFLFHNEYETAVRI